MEHNLGIGSWFSRRARTAPHRLALIEGSTRRTFRELDARATRLAHGLVARGISRGDRVAFLGENQSAALELLVACGLVGAIYVPLHPGFDRDTLQEVLVQAELAVLVVASRQIDLARSVPAASRVPLRWLASELDAICRVATEPLDRRVSLDDPCLIAFTSGTTGRSKGVVLTHGNLVFNALNLYGALDVRPGDRLLVSAPLYRMGGLGFALPTLLRGGCCVLQERADPEESARLVQAHRATMVFDSVGALGGLLSAADRRGHDLSSLRLCATGGSPVPASLVRAFADRGLVLQTGYGLTEAAPVVLVMDRDEVAAHPEADGRPVPYASVKVVDRKLREVGPGEIGELLVRGPNVTPGYWRNPQATERALVDGWLRTGDVVRADEDGLFSVVGRLDDALVLDGQTFHPGLLEATLVAEGASHAAVVQPLEGVAPVAFVAGVDLARRDRIERAVRASLGDRARVAYRAALPLNPNGKILRERLRPDREPGLHAR